MYNLRQSTLRKNGYKKAIIVRIYVLSTKIVFVVVQFYLWFNFYFLLLWGLVMYENEFKTRENRNLTKDKIEPHHISMKL